MGLESGKINTEHFDDGMFYRAFLKISGKKSFSSSALRFKTNVSPEILDLSHRISGVHLYADIEYAITLGREKFVLGGLAKHQVHYIKSARKQLFNEFQARIHYSHKFSKSISLQIQELLIYRDQVASFKNSMFKNLQQANIILKYYPTISWKVGSFYENTDFNFPGKEKKHQTRFGPSVGFNYKKALIFNSSYKYGFYKEGTLNDHQINILAGKYLNKKISLFLFVYYLWRVQENSITNSGEFNPLESYNNVSIKMGYDLKKKTHIYGKILYEEQEIFQFGNTVSTIQGVIGLQQSF